MFCAYTRPRYHVNIYKTIGPLVGFISCMIFFFQMLPNLKRGVLMYVGSILLTYVLTVLYGAPLTE